MHFLIPLERGPDLKPSVVRPRLALVIATLAWVILGPVVSREAAAQDRSIGGHVGLALPVVVRSQGATTTMADGFIASFPMGIVFRKNTNVPVDIGFVPTLQRGQPLGVAFGVSTAHPVGHGLALGGGVLYDVSHSAWNIAPVIDRVLFTLAPGRVIVGDLYIPVGFPKDTNGKRFRAIALVAHIGLAF